MKKYIYSCQNKDYKGIDVKVIMSENDPVNLRHYEAFYIRKCKLTFNSREECSEFADLLLQYFILKTILLALLEVLCLETVYHWSLVFHSQFISLAFKQKSHLLHISPSTLFADIQRARNIFLSLMMPLIGESLDFRFYFLNNSLRPHQNSFTK